MKQVTVRIHHDEGVWWAESPSVPGFTSAADTLQDLRVLVREGLHFALDGKLHFIVEVGARAAMEQARKTTAASSRESLQAPVSFPKKQGYRAVGPRAATNPRLVQV